MANFLNQNPISLTTTQTSYKAAVAATLGTLFTLRVVRVYWFQPANVGDQVLIIDPSSGREWLRARCETAGQSQIFPVNEEWSDFAVDQLDSGALKIYLA